MSWKMRAILSVGLVLMSAVDAQSQPSVEGIYTCTDAKGRKITSDRPISDCLDREQRVLNPSGTVKLRVGPNLTALERAELEAKEKREAEERARLAEEKRRDRALLVRYPSKPVHDAERAEALAQIDVVIRAADNRIVELKRQRDSLDVELEFYKKNPTKTPASLKRQLDEITQSQAVQQRFIADQDSEKKRVNARFDDELARLRLLWPLKATPAANVNSR